MNGSSAQLALVLGESQAQGWDSILESDEWRQQSVPNGDLSTLHRGNRYIRFGRIEQPWLKFAAKQFAKDRLLAASSFGTVKAYVTDLFVFSEWLEENYPDSPSPSIVTREVLEDFLLEVLRSDSKPATKQRHIGSLRRLLEAERRKSLKALPADAVIEAREIPRGDYSLPPKMVDDVLFDQFIDASNLAKMDSQYRVLLLIVATTGMRVSSILTLRRGALEFDNERAPYLRSDNVKMNREMLIPVSDRVAELWKLHLQLSPGSESDYAFPSRADADRPHIAHSTLRRILHRYIQRANIRDADGELAMYVHPHLFRHYLGTSLINDGVDITVVAKMLDHNSLEMTGRYAHLHDTTMRAAVEGLYKRVNARGEYIALPSSDLMSDARWQKERVSRAKQSLANGYCGLPAVQKCPHPNACLDCDNFLTDASFLPVHENHLAESKRLREEHVELGFDRLVELVDSDINSLEAIIGGIKALEVDPSESSADDFDLRDGLAKQ